LNDESKNVSRISFGYFPHILLGNFWLVGWLRDGARADSPHDAILILLLSPLPGFIDEI
jgi:hypothetical protein